MTAPVQETVATEFDLEIGELEMEIREYDETAGWLTDGHTNPSCRKCTCEGLYCA